VLPMILLSRLPEGHSKSDKMFSARNSMQCHRPTDTVYGLRLLGYQFVKPRLRGGALSDDDTCLSVCLSPLSTLNLHSTEGATVSYDAANPFLHQSLWFHLNCLHGSWTWTGLSGHLRLFVFSFFFYFFLFFLVTLASLDPADHTQLFSPR